eukprot:CAMPEP_0170147002 /NCGR_PEP_ID=MMETSP0033_2-20121228/32822_1 /TAXON_ID=195969 /ORGANISM="Dolichomastix tenuilepis, Strain CCMP3274" /LENGTH=60 /DNA_ID=CAMNT_0010383773 /DNA_START=67 /DNA_END=246 /DNA_ORIENTATION=-
MTVESTLVEKGATDGVVRGRKVSNMLMNPWGDDSPGSSGKEISETNERFDDVACARSRSA